MVFQAPNLFGQKGIIELIQLPETHAPFPLWKTKFLPANLVNVLLLSSISPPKFSYEHFNFLNQPFWKFKARHGVGGDCLNNYLH